MINFLMLFVLLYASFIFYFQVKIVAGNVEHLQGASAESFEKVLYGEPPGPLFRINLHTNIKNQTLIHTMLKTLHTNEMLSYILGV